jgi:hypothetical protein
MSGSKNISAAAITSKNERPRHDFASGGRRPVSNLEIDAAIKRGRLFMMARNEDGHNQPPSNHPGREEKS